MITTPLSCLLLLPPPPNNHGKLGEARDRWRGDDDDEEEGEEALDEEPAREVAKPPVTRASFLAQLKHWPMMGGWRIPL
jgi:hypothetical protein